MTQKTAATDVASFLRENPDFFNQYPDILTEIRLKPKSSKHTISFAEHQIAYLRDRINELEQKMVELLKFGLENDALLVKYHKMALTLIHANSLPALFESVYDIIRTDFDLPYVAIRLWPQEKTLLVGAEFETVTDVPRRYIEQQKAPYMGSIDSLPCKPEFAQWLWVTPEEIGSVALVPLRYAGKTLGALLIASSDKTKFSQQMGTLFLEQMAEQIAAAIHKLLL